MYDGSNQKDGLRFTNLSIPQGATITSAYLQFEAKEAQSEATNLILQGQAADNAATFTTTAGNVSSRPRTAASVSWAPPAWNTVGEAGAGQRTPDLSAVIQEIVDRPGWASGNALAIIITGTGHRTAQSYDGKSCGAPLLHVEFGSGPRPNPAPRDSFALSQNSPNPFNPQTLIRFDLGQACRTRLYVYDAQGRLVTRLVDRELAAGPHATSWSGHNDGGRAVASGVYWCRLEAASFVQTRRMILLR